MKKSLWRNDSNQLQFNDPWKRKTHWYEKKKPQQKEADTEAAAYLIQLSELALGPEKTELLKIFPNKLPDSLCSLYTASESNLKPHQLQTLAKKETCKKNKTDNPNFTFTTASGYRQCDPTNTDCKCELKSQLGLLPIKSSPHNNLTNHSGPSLSCTGTSFSNPTITTTSTVVPSNLSSYFPHPSNGKFLVAHKQQVLANNHPSYNNPTAGKNSMKGNLTSSSPKNKQISNQTSNTPDVSSLLKKFVPDCPLDFFKTVSDRPANSPRNGLLSGQTNQHSLAPLKNVKPDPISIRLEKVDNVSDSIHTIPSFSQIVTSNTQLIQI